MIHARERADSVLQLGCANPISVFAAKAVHRRDDDAPARSDLGIHPDDRVDLSNGAAAKSEDEHTKRGTFALHFRARDRLDGRTTLR